MLDEIIQKASLTIAIAVISGFCLVQAYDFRTIDTSEFGGLEISQLITLGICFVIGAITLTYVIIRKLGRFDFTVSFMLWLITIAIFGRETSWGSVYNVAHPLSDKIELAAIVFFALSIVWLSVYLLLKEPHRKQFILGAFKLPALPLFSTATVFVYLAAYFEGQKSIAPYHQLLEEGYECIGYVIFLYGYVLFSKKFLANPT